MDATEKLGYSISFAGYRRENGHVYALFAVTNGKTRVSGFTRRTDAQDFIKKITSDANEKRKKNNLRFS